MILNKDEIIKGADIVSVIENTAPDIRLTKKGVNYVAKCPLPGHNEKTGSFTVNPHKNIWKCFGCGKGGDAAKFVMEYEKALFPVALEKVAKISKTKIQYDKEFNEDKRKEYLAKQKEVNEKKESLRALFKLVVEELEKKNKWAETEKNGIKYTSFAGREYKVSTVQKFNLLQPFAGNVILELANKKKWDVKKLIQLGLINLGDNGGAYDIWKHRFLFPIRNPDGYFSSIAGRAIPEKTDEGWAKYMNGKSYYPDNYNPDTDNILFNKSAAFYGFYEGKKDIYVKESVIVVEGYTDVISLHEAGYTIAVATCGTAFTSQHCDFLNRSGIKDVNLFFDGDKAGIQAAERAVKTCLQSGITPYVTLCDIFSEAAFKSFYDEAVKPGTKLFLYEQLKEDKEFLDSWVVDDPEKTLPDLLEKINTLSVQNKYLVSAKTDGVVFDHELKAHDPDSLVREFSKAKFKSFLELKKQDGLIWLTLKDFKKNDPQSLSATIQLAASLLVNVKESNRSGFLKALTQSDNMGAVQRSIEGEIKKLEELNGGKIQKNYELTPEQVADATDYGVFERNNQYWMYDPENYHSWGTAVSNFIFIPRYLIRDPNTPARILTIKNLHGHTATLNMATDVFGSEGQMINEVAQHGNFIFEPFAKGPYFKMIRKLVYDKMRDEVAYRLQALGHHHNGFYVWYNGLFTYDGQFLEVDDMGLVQHNKIKYLLPGRGEVTDENFEKVDGGNEYLEKFRYYTGECICFREWSKKFITIYTANGVIGMLWAFSAMFRDIIWKKHKGFPHLNFSGKKGSGKSRIMWSIVALFGDAYQDGSLGLSTYKSFFDSLEKKSNAVVWFEEFHSKLDFGTWIKSMMGVFDNTGRNKLKLSKLNGSTSSAKTTIKSALAYTGQDEPTGLGDDNALWSRTIVREPKKNTTKGAYKLLDELQAIEDSGQLTGITCEVLKHRDKVEKQYHRVMQEEMEAIKLQLDLLGSYAKKAEDRTLNNVVPLLTIYRILAPTMDFPFTYEELFSIVIEQIKYQTQGIMTMDKEAVWWSKIETLTNSRVILHNVHICVEETKSVTVEVSRGKTKEVEFSEEKTVLFIRMKDCYSLYRKDMVKEQNKDLTGDGQLFRDLEKSEPFIGRNRGKRFGNHVYRCYMFDVGKLEELGVEFKTTLEMGASNKEQDEKEELTVGNTPF